MQLRLTGTTSNGVEHAEDYFLGCCVRVVGRRVDRFRSRPGRRRRGGWWSRCRCRRSRCERRRWHRWRWHGRRGHGWRGHGWHRSEQRHERHGRWRCKFRKRGWNRCRAGRTPESSSGAQPGSDRPLMVSPEALQHRGLPASARRPLSFSGNRVSRWLTPAGAKCDPALIATWPHAARARCEQSPRRWPSHRAPAA